MDKKDISRKMFEIKVELETKVLDEETKIRLQNEYQQLRSQLSKVLIDELNSEKETIKGKV